MEAARLVALDLVVRLRPTLARELEPVADLYAFHGLRPHQRRGQTHVESRVFRRVGAEARRDAARTHLDDSADGVAIGARLVDALFEVVAEDAPLDLDPELREQPLRHGTGSDEDRGVPRARTLERVPDVGEPELLRPREVGVPGPRQRHRLRPLPLRLALGRPRAHPPRPVLVVAVADDERERRAERPAVAEPGEHLDLVALDLLPR